MKHHEHLTILSGAGSPHAEQYRPVYGMIADEAQQRGISVHLVDYVGVGHYPDCGHGLSLPAAVEKARTDIKNHPTPSNSTLLCRSFGCVVGCHLIANHREELKAFTRIVLWGPVPLHISWNLFARHRDSLNQTNEEAKRKGVVFSTDFWQSIEPVEETVKAFKFISVDIGFGTKDKYCNAAFANYLGKILEGNTSCPVRVAEIANAEHEIRPEADERIKSEYFRLFFSSRS
jgi:hypothetical protein